MSTAVRKKMTARLEVSPFAEMKPEQRKWLETNKKLKAKYQPFQFRHDVELDPRKWTEKTLGKSLEALVRMDLKILDARIVQAMKDMEKQGGMKGELLAVTAAQKEYDKTAKTIENKVSLAVEELASGGGDATKSLKLGKAALGKIGNVKIDGMFKRSGDASVKALQALHDVLDDSVDPTSHDDAYKRTATVIATAKAAFDKTRAQATSAIAFLAQTGSKIAKDRNAPPEMAAFGREVAAQKKVFKAFIVVCQRYGKLMKTVGALIRAKKLGVMHLDRVIGPMSAYDREEFLAARLEKTLASLSNRFADLERQLK